MFAIRVVPPEIAYEVTVWLGQFEMVAELLQLVTGFFRDFAIQPFHDQLAEDALVVSCQLAFMDCSYDSLLL